MTVRWLTFSYQQAGRTPEAIAVTEQRVWMVQANQTPLDQKSLEDTYQYLLTMCYSVGDYSKAASFGLQRVEQLRQAEPADPAAISTTLAVAGKNYLAARQPARAEPILRECLTLRERHQPDGWSTFNTMSLLGEARLDQKQYADAEPLLLKGYEGLKQREKTIPSNGATRIPEALDRMIELYTATNRPDEVKKWRFERLKYPEIAPPPRVKK